MQTRNSRDLNAYEAKVQRSIPTVRQRGPKWYNPKDKVGSSVVHSQHVDV